MVLGQSEQAISYNDGRDVTSTGSRGGRLAIHEMNTLGALEKNGCTIGIGGPSGGNGGWSGSGEDDSENERSDGEELGSEHLAGFEGCVD